MTPYPEPTRADAGATVQPNPSARGRPGRVVLFAIGALFVVSGCALEQGAAQATTSGPRLSQWFDCMRDGGVVISAHRGRLSPDAAENAVSSIEATGRAIPGAVVEIDIARTRDGALVLMHDEGLERTTTGSGRVADLTLAEVRATRLTTRGGRVLDEAPPTLAEALAAADRVGSLVSLDLKPSDEAATVDLAKAVIAEVRRAGAQDRVILITYSDATARAVAGLAPEMMLSVGLSSPEGLEGLEATQVLAWTGTREPRPALWQALRERGVEVQFGTLGPAGRRRDDLFAADGDPSEYRDLFRDGVTVIATDTPLVVQRVLAAEVAQAGQCRR